MKIHLADPNEEYRPLVEAILASPGRLHMDGGAMYYFAFCKRQWKANLERRFIEWIFAQPPHPELMESRRLVLDMSRVARKLVRDQRFLKSDAQLVCDIEQSPGIDLKLTPVEGAKLDKLIFSIRGTDQKHRYDTPAPVLDEIRALIRKGISAP